MALLTDQSLDAYSNIVQGTNSQTLTFTMPANVVIDVETVVATVTNGSGGGVTPELTIRDPSGEVIATRRQATQIPAADSGTATWALRLTDDSGSNTSTTGLLYTNTLAAPAVTIDTTGTDLSGFNLLEIWALFRSDAAAANVVNVGLTFNNDASAKYDSVWIRNDSGAVGVVNLGLQTAILSQMPGALATPSTVYGLTRMTIPFYSQAINHTVEFTNGWRDSAALHADRATLGVCDQQVAAAITSLQWTAKTGNFVTGCQVMVLGR